MLYEVLIDISDCEFYLPKKIFRNILSGKLPDSRMNRIVNKFKDEGYKNRINIETYKFSNLEPDVIYSFYHSKEYFYIKDDSDNLHIYRLYYINGTQPWIIQKTNKGETIHFMKKNESYEIVDKGTAYAKYLEK